jgi:uncharacterized protein YndB with AHSA1/START domain
MSDTKDQVSAERVIDAPASAIFDLIATPSRHHEFDGSGTVRGAKKGGERAKMGSVFGMSMKMGIPYAMTSTVIEYEEDRRFAWQTRGPGPIGKLVGGRIWRYELEPAGDGATKVTETWDISEESPVTKLVVKGLGAQTKKNMAATLDRIQELLAT